LSLNGLAAFFVAVTIVHFYYCIPVPVHIFWVNALSTFRDGERLGKRSRKDKKDDKNFERKKGQT
jgi:hypothetical protein